MIKKIQDYFIDASEPKETDFETVINIIADAGKPLAFMQIRDITEFHSTRLKVIMAELVEQGLVEKKSWHNKQFYGPTHRKKKLNLSRYKIQRKVKTQGLHDMMAYAEKAKSLQNESSL